jgi:hypothetical protein
VPFQAHIELLQLFLSRRDEIVERVQDLLNAQRKPAEYLQDGDLLSRHFDDCFYASSGVTGRQSRLRSELEQAHWAGGFRPREIPGLHNGPADPAEMMMRAFYMWRQTRWPGRAGRVRYAHTLFNLFVIRWLELLSLRIWDDGADRANSADDRLAQIQDVLDELWKMKTADQPALVRDARWLVQMAQSLATDDLGAYFKVAEHVAETLSEENRIEIHKAGVRMAAGHLRSQIRYHATKKGASLDEASVVLSTRDSNALDFALLIQELVPLLNAYERAVQRHDIDKRVELADAICQGVSPDPELFLNRLELLGAYSMIEHLFITTSPEGQAVYTPMGQRHVRLLEEYAARMVRVSKPLGDDCSRFRPVPGAYSPYGVLYGFSADLLKHMALKATQPDAVSQFGLEDVFVAGDASTGKLAWVNGWRKLPHLTRDIEKMFEYPQQFAEDVFDRIERALHTADVARTGRLFLAAAGTPQADSNVAITPEPYDETQRLSDWQEGKFLLRYETPGGWWAITKSVIAEALGSGHDAAIAGLPPLAAEALKLRCPGLAILS